MIRQPTTSVNATMEALFCPSCGSPYVESTGTFLAQDPSKETYQCKACGWSGIRELLAVTTISAQNPQGTDIADYLIRDLKLLMAKEVGAPIGRFLMKWGFLPEADPKILGRYIVAIASAIVMAIITERAAIEMETKRGN